MKGIVFLFCFIQNVPFCTLVFKMLKFNNLTIYSKSLDEFKNIKT